MKILEINEFNTIMQSEEEGILSELFATLRALTQIEDTAQVSSSLYTGDPMGWGWTAWW